MQGKMEIIPIRGIKEVAQGQDVGSLVVQACKKNGITIREKDIVVVTHKIVSKAEGRLIDLETVIPSKFAIRTGKHIGKEPRQVELILSESRRIVKMVKGLIITETRHGFVCANGGVDQSNVPAGKAVLLPIRPDQSARRIKSSIKKQTRKGVAVIISDTFGRAWREGQVDVAIGIAGIYPFSDYRGLTDQYGYDLRASVICNVDELASAAELCMNKLDRVPAAIIRGYNFKTSNVPSRVLSRKPARDLFR